MFDTDIDGKREERRWWESKVEVDVAHLGCNVRLGTVSKLILKIKRF